MYKVRLISEAYWSSEKKIELDALPTTIRTLFNELVAKYAVKSAVLELWHDAHGWKTACYDSGYIIISNPLGLDYHRMRQALAETRRHWDMQPTRQEWQNIQAKRRQADREA